MMPSDPNELDAVQLEQRLFDLVDHELARCNPAATPHICRAQSTPATLEGLREKIVRVALRQELTIPEAVVAVEREMGANPDVD